MRDGVRGVRVWRGGGVRVWRGRGMKWWREGEERWSEGSGKVGGVRGERWRSEGGGCGNVEE